MRNDHPHHMRSSAAQYAPLADNTGSPVSPGRRSLIGSASPASSRSGSSATSRALSLSASSIAGSAPRLWDTSEEELEPEDLSDYFDRLTSRRGIHRRGRYVLLSRALLLSCCAVQTACATTFISTVRTMPARTDAQFMLVTVAAAAASGVVGAAGAYSRSGSLLRWFVISQVWCMSNIVAKCVLAQHSSRRQHVLCADEPSASASCLTDEFDTRSLLLAFGVVYCSIFVADTLAQAFQDQTVHASKIVQMVWLMQKRTLVSVSRFEAIIHAHFEELVNNGLLQLTPRARKGGG